MTPNPDSFDPNRPETTFYSKQTATPEKPKFERKRRVWVPKILRSKKFIFGYLFFLIILSCFAYLYVNGGFDGRIKRKIGGALTRVEYAQEDDGIWRVTLKAFNEDFKSNGAVDGAEAMIVVKAKGVTIAEDRRVKERPSFDKGETIAFDFYLDEATYALADAIEFIYRIGEKTGSFEEKLF